MRLEGLGKLKKKEIHLIGTRSRDFPACSIVKLMKGKGKAIPVTGREDPQGCETLRLPYFV
jgi:hypothetical protein